MKLWREEGKSYKEMAERVEHYKETISRFSRIYLIGNYLSFMQPMFRVYLDNGGLLVEIIDSEDKMSDPEAGVLKIIEVPKRP